MLTSLKYSSAVPAGDRRDRLEAIQVIGLTRDGWLSERICPFTRTDEGEIVFGETISDAGGAVHLIEPIRRTWARMGEAS
jgi:hypothetical protein